MECGVSVSKMVQQQIMLDSCKGENHEQKWVEEAQFEGLHQLPIKVKLV